jgi:PAS domain S-box-containing protein
MGGKDLLERGKYEALFLRLFSLIGVLGSVSAVLYAEIAEMMLVPRSVLYSTPFTVIFCVLLLAFCLMQYIFRYKKRMHSKYVGWYLIAAHLFASINIIMISGVLSPLTVFWIFLLTVTDLYYSRVGTLLSALWLTFVAVVYISIAQPDSIISYVLSASYIFVVVVMGLFVSYVRLVHSNEHNDLIKSQYREQQQHAKLLTLINSVNQAIISLDSKGIVQTYNAATLNLLDTNDSLTGKAINSILHVHTSDDTQVDIFKRIKASQHMTEDESLSHTFVDGESIHLGVTWTAIKGTEDSSLIDGYIVVIRDITKAKSLAEERDEFISVVSHELRTPITIAEGTLSNVQLFLERGADPKKLAASVKDAHDQIIYLSKMVNDLSTLSRADRGVGDEKERIDVLDLVQSLYNEYAPKAEKKGLVMNLDAHGHLGNVYTSRLYLEEMLQNFITNAIKYTPDGSLTLSAKRDSGKIVFCVTDTGIGIAKNELKKVFNKFYRSEDYRTRETNGTGLGLYVVQKLAKKMDTDVVVASRLNHGSRFSFSLPVSTNQLDSTPKKQ